MTSGERAVVVRTRRLAVGYSGKAVATVSDLDLIGGVIWNVTGPNGAGKTTLLKTLAGLLPPVSGELQRGCGMGRSGVIYVHPVPYIFAGSVDDNLRLGRPRLPDADRVAGLFGLTALRNRDARTLSHGQQRRLALARAMAVQPALLLLDEPEGGLDDEGISVWRACAIAAVESGNPVLVVVAHRPQAFAGLTVREVKL
jgi:ABC-type multidrug transport system ATPase subunit